MKGCAPKIAGIGCVFVLLFSAILLFAMLFSDDTEESKEPVARISAPSLYAAYAKNEIEADNKYKDKYLEVNGYVDIIGKNIVGSPYIALLTNDLVGRVQCMIADQDIAKAATIKRGQSVSLVGKCNGKELINVVLYECVFKDVNEKNASQSENKAIPSNETEKIQKAAQRSVNENTSLKSIEIPQNGTFVDERDKKTYKYVTIGKLVWMAENLNFKIEDSWCYNDKKANCKKFGRLYNYDAAMRACPEGWHLPSLNEWKNLFSVVEGKSIDDLGISIVKSKVAKKLKTSSGWKDWYENGSRSGNGDDIYGFAALPAGIRTIHDDFNSLGEYAFFWTSTEYHTAYDPKYTQLDDTEGLSKHADRISFANNVDWPNFAQYGLKILGHSVRCVKNMNK